VFFLGNLSIQCKIRRDRPIETRWSTGLSRSTCWPPLFYVNNCYFWARETVLCYRNW